VKEMNNKPRPLNYVIFTIMVSAVFLGLLVLGKTAVPAAIMLFCLAAIVLDWQDSKRPIKLRLPSREEVIGFLILALCITAYISVAISVRRSGDDLSPHFLDNRTFLISLWIVALLLPLNRMWTSEKNADTEPKVRQVSSESAPSASSDEPST